MLVIADSSPIIALINIRSIHVLPALFGQVTVPPQVAAELASSNRPTIVREFIANRPGWLSIQAPSRAESIVSLHEGEIAAIHLARELKADLLLIDEVQGRRAAADRKIPITGTVGVLEMAAMANLLDLKETFERLKQTDFWISPLFLDERLSAHLRRQAKPAT